MDCQKPFYDPFSSTFNLCIYIYIFSLNSMIRFLFVLGNFLEDPSANHFCHVDIVIKDYPHHFSHRQSENKHFNEQ